MEENSDTIYKLEQGNNIYTASILPDSIKLIPCSESDSKTSNKLQPFNFPFCDLLGVELKDNEPLNLKVVFHNTKF